MRADARRDKDRQPVPHPYDSKEQVYRDIREIIRRLIPKGLCLIPLRFTEKNVLLYLYRPGMAAARSLRRDSLRSPARDGLHTLRLRRCLAQLMRRMQQADSEFPHEVGLFLSYPPEDVKGFINNEAANYKYIGLWKVYGDEEGAKRTFARYKKCTELYCKLWQSGSSLEQLAVAI